MGGKSSKTEDSGDPSEGTSSGDGDKKLGEPVKYDPTFNGPIKNRSCTDVLCCILFIVCFIAMLCVAFWAYIFGNPETLLYPSDSQGNLCGTGDYNGKPNVFFFDLTECARVGPAIISSGCPTPQICVQTCPAAQWVYIQEVIDAYTAPVPQSLIDSGNLFCTYETQQAFADGTNTKICVASCPTTEWTWIMQLDAESRDPGAVADRANVLYCKYDVDPVNTDKSLQELVLDQSCAAYYLDSEPLVGRCIPSLITELADSVLTANTTSLVDRFGAAVNGTLLEDTSWLTYLLNVQSYGEQVLADLHSTWFLILGMLAVAAIVSFIWILLMRWIAGPIVWITLILFLGLFSFGTYYCFTKYVDLNSPNSNATQVDSITDLQLTTDLDYWSNLTYTWLALGIISALMLLIVLIILIFLRNRIRIAIALIGESSRAVGCMMFTLIFPIWPFIFEVIVFAFWGASAVYLASAGSSKYGLTSMNSTNNTITTTVTWPNGSEIVSQVHQVAVEALTQVCDPNDYPRANGTEGSVCSFIAYGGDEYTIYMQFYQLFMLFWLMNFVVAVGQCTLAGAFASYYWAFDKSKDIPAFPLLAGLWRCFRYHLGSLAFGSLIIAIIQLIRVMLEYLDQKLKGSGNKVAKFFLCCLKCFFWCLEKFMKFINKNAYILIAVYGKNFCASAKNAFFLIMRNIVRVVVVDKVTDFLLFIGKLVVVAAVGALSFFFFSGDLASSIPWDSISIYVAAYTPTLNFYLIPVIVIIIGSYIIASAFFSVYSMAVDTLFLCFLEDLERHDGSAEKPYYMSKGLMDILGKKNKKPAGADKD